MSKAANRAKTKWNADNYRQVKVSVDPALAGAFRLACDANGVSMASVLSAYMAEYSKTVVDEPRLLDADLSTRRKRRQSLETLVHWLEQIRDEQEHAKENIPENLRGAAAYEAAEESVALMDEAVEILGRVY